MVVKICKKCGKEKKTSEFHRAKNRKDGLYPYCKECKRLDDKISYKKHKTERCNYQKIYRAANLGKKQLLDKIYYDNNKDKIKEYKKKYYEENKEKIYVANKIWRKKNIDKVRTYRNKWRKDNLEYHQNYLEKNKEELKQKRNIQLKTRRENDPKYKILSNLRSRLRMALNNNQKTGKTIELLGCSIDFLKKHLESLFIPKMSWANYGSYWEIDHILPCSVFDLQHSEEQEICFAWWNLQPLEKIKNLKKRDIIL